jgi:hypothetical protein
MITVEIKNGAQYQVNWKSGMNVQTALEEAFDSTTAGAFTYGLQYFGSSYGYLVTMINETYETFKTAEAPFFYWEFFLNSQPSSTGIDNTFLNDGDVVSFEFNVYNASAALESITHIKHKQKAK